MNALVKTEKPKLMLVDFMADKYSLSPADFVTTVKNTCGLAKASDSEFGAFLIVAKEYDLNPILKEIYAFPAKGGGIVPIVSVDGWLNLVNSHPQCDGFEFDTAYDEKGELVSATCRIYRKDRSRPTAVTELLSECVRPTDPWKMKNRMLRHKTLIQCARYAFGFAGIYDEDEAAKFADMRDVTPAATKTAPTPPRPPVKGEATVGTSEKQASKPTQTVADDIEDATIIDRETGEINDQVEDEKSIADMDDTEFFQALETRLGTAGDPASVEEIWNEFDALARFEGDETSQGIAMAIKRLRLKSIGA